MKLQSCWRYILAAPAGSWTEQRPEQLQQLRRQLSSSAEDSRSRLSCAERPPRLRSWTGTEHFGPAEAKRAEKRSTKLAFVRLQGFKPMALSYRASVRINKTIPDQADIPTVVNVDPQNPSQDLNPRPKRLWPMHQVVEVQRIPYLIMVQLKARCTLLSSKRHKELSKCFYILYLITFNYFYLFIYLSSSSVLLLFGFMLRGVERRATDRNNFRGSR